MPLLLITIKDNAVQAFQPINTVRAKGEAIRGFQDAINNEQNRQLHKHPEDFDLYLVGTFDDETGEITVQKPELIIRGKDVKNV